MCVSGSLSGATISVFRGFRRQLCLWPAAASLINGAIVVMAVGGGIFLHEFVGSLET